jgi:hypothetical protein
MWSKAGSDKNITQEEYLKVIECLWDREIIPELVSLSNQGKLKNKDGDNLRVLVHKALDVSYSDVGECSSYIATLKDVANKNTFVNIPESIKVSARENIQGDVIFNADVKDEYNKLLGSGYSKGNIVVIPRD